MTPRDKLDTDFPTIELRNRLYEIRDEALNHMALYEPDQKITDLLKEAEKRISYWVNVNHKYLITDDEYYERIAHRILEPVYITLNSRAGVYDDLEEEREKAVETRDRLAEELETLRNNINHYYGSFGGCRAWEHEETEEQDIPVDPDLPDMFDETPNDERPDSHEQWWYQPYIQTDEFNGCPSDPEKHEQWRKSWYAEYPTGTRYNLRCLDGGAWDRSTNHGFFSTLEAAQKRAREIML